MQAVVALLAVMGIVIARRILAAERWAEECSTLTWATEAKVRLLGGLMRCAAPAVLGERCHGTLSAPFLTACKALSHQHTCTVPQSAHSLCFL